MGAVTGKPARKVMEFVDGGGSVARRDSADVATKAPQHPLKFSNGELFQRLEAARTAGPVKLPRNTWILQAIAEKLERDGQGK